MSFRSNLPCWEIMQCEPEQIKRCPAAHSEKECWEVMQEINSQCANICEDCFVYLARQHQSVLSEEEIITILRHRGMETVKDPCFSLYCPTKTAA